ncbi:MAG: hypothetical protein FJ291_17430 [Planctomycetes bacterium]|nr:hypothetical protein [Planctomycetota bacterium]
MIAQLVVTVSVEPDDPSVVGCSGAYRSFDGLERLQELCRRYGVRPTYLLTYSAAARIADYREWACEFGAHLHPEEVPPIAEGERGNHTLRPSQVEPPRLREKLVNLVERVAEATGRRPTSYRAGFFGLTPAQIPTLLELGIEADSSLGPLEKVGKSHPFLRAPFAPYLMDPADVCRPLRGHSGLKAEIRNQKSEMKPLVEVPLTSVFRRPFPRGLFGIYFRMPGVVRGALRALGIAEVLGFRPATATAEELLAVCRRTERMGIPAVISIHSNELWPGTSAAVPTEAASAAYFARLEQVLAHCQANRWTSLTLTQVARAVREEAR